MTINQLKVGDKVRLTRGYIRKWVISHDAYMLYLAPKTKEVGDDYYSNVMIGILSLMGPLYGTVIDISEKYARVSFNIDRIKDTQWYDPIHLK